MNKNFLELFKEYVQQEEKYLEENANWKLSKLTKTSYVFREGNKEIYQGTLNQELSKKLTDKLKEATIVIDGIQDMYPPYYYIIQKKGEIYHLATFIVKENHIRISFNGYIQDSIWYSENIPQEIKNQIETIEETFTEMLKSSNKMRLFDVTGGIEVTKKI